MHWNILLLLTAGLNAPAPENTPTPEIAIPTITAPVVIFENYAKGYETAGQTHKPMLVVLNPPASEDSQRGPIPLEDLRHDEKIGALLDKYVVVVVDTGTDHGKKVHEVFGSKPLPYLTVIDENQKKQVFRTSHEVNKTQLEKLLETYQYGTRTQQAQLMTNCPLCQKKLFGF